MSLSMSVSAVAEPLSPSIENDLAAPVMSDDARSAAGRFSSLMSAGDVTTPEAVEAAGATKEGNMADVIVDKLRSVEADYRKIKEDTYQAINDTSSEMTIGSLYRVQFSFINTTLVVDVFSKCISKSTQHVDQLTKLQ